MISEELERGAAPPSDSARSLLVVAEEQEQQRSGPPQSRLCGFAVAWRVAGETQVLYLAVRPTARRRGIGTGLLQALLAASGPGPATLELRASNAAAAALYSKIGFRQVGRRRRYYRDGEDALVLSAEPAAVSLAAAAGE